MTPDPYLRRQAWALAAVLVGAGVAGLTPVTATGATVTLVWWLWLRHMYRRDRRLSSYDPRGLPALARRELLDRGLDQWMAVTIFAACLALVVGALLQPFNVMDAAVSVLAAGALLGAGGVLWSSLVDWYWVLPRVSGLLGHRPCRSAPEGTAQRVSWEEVTRWWLAHRIASVVLFSLGTALVLGASVSLALGGTQLDTSARAVIGAITGGISGLALVFQRKAAEAAPHVTRPNTRVASFYRDPHEGAGWVVDVALEGAQLVLREQHRARVAEAVNAGRMPSFCSEKGDTSVALTERLTKVERFEACSNCSGMNWYCMENPRAWDKD